MREGSLQGNGGDGEDEGEENYVGLLAHLERQDGAVVDCYTC